jgi:hypothetical protein
MRDDIQAYLDAINGDSIDVPTDASPVEFLQAVYRDKSQPMPRRMKAAEVCAPYIHPKLSAAAVLVGDDFASKLERARLRSASVLELEATNVEEGGEGK